MRKKEFDRQISRRTFLKSTGAALGAAGLMAMGLGCSAPADETTADAPETTKAPETTAAPEPVVDNPVIPVNASAEYEVINTDIIVVGAGNNALSAAIYASSAGKNVTVIDKGPFRHAGVSGMSWDAFGPYYLPEMYEGVLAGLGPQNCNEKNYREALYNDPEPNKYVYMINHGQSLPDRLPDGKVRPYGMDIMCMGQFYRREMDDLYEKGNVNVVDQTMVTDILVNDGKCLGVVGLHIPTGKLRVFRSEATILCTGGCTWMYGWLTVSAATISTPDNTADADMAAYRHGAGIGDSEYAQYDVLGIYPEGLGYGFGSNICADAQEAHAMVDINGDPVFAPDDPNVGDRTYFNQQLAKVIALEGRGTPNGGVYVSIGDQAIRYANERNLPVMNKFGVDPRKERIEVSPEMYEHSGHPIIDSTMMTEIEGLFHGRGSGTNGSIGGAQAFSNRYFGAYAGRCAVDYANKKAPHDELDWAPVLAEYDRLQELLNRKVEGGIRPHVIRHAIQKACFNSLGIYRTTANMEAALAELQRIRKEDMPRQIVTSDSPVWNREWKEAIENVNMLDLAEMSVRASLMREETRGMYLRAEFPELDNENWACTLVCYNKDGEMEFVKKTEWE